MKSLFIILTALLFPFFASAQNPKVKMYHNVNETGKECIKEFISYDTEISLPLLKYIYIYDDQENLLNMTICAWNQHINKWMNEKKYEYTYNVNGQIILTTFTVWDKKQMKWSKKSHQMIYEYDKEGQFLSLTKTETNNSTNNNTNLLVQK